MGAEKKKKFADEAREMVPVNLSGTVEMINAAIRVGGVEYRELNARGRGARRRGIIEPHLLTRDTDEKLVEWILKHGGKQLSTAEVRTVLSSPSFSAAWVRRTGQAPPN